ncbi:hypothetical protein D3C84_703930 [compost metagenome]
MHQRLQGPLDLGMQLVLLYHPGHPKIVQPGKNQFIGDHSQHQDLQVREITRDVIDQLQAVTELRIARHVVVGNEDVRAGGVQSGNQVSGVRSLRDYLEALIRVNELAHPKQHDRMVIGNDNGGFVHV